MLFRQLHQWSFSIPPKTAFLYENFKLHEETASYRVFEAEARNSSHEQHLIRILDPTKDLVDKDFDSAATLFIQELFHLESRCPGTILIGTLEICAARKQVACALRKHDLMSLQIDQIHMIEEMLSLSPQDLSTLEKLHMKEPEIQNSSISSLEKTKKKKIIIIGNINFMSVIILFMLSSLCVIHLRLIKSLRLN